MNHRLLVERGLEGLDASKFSVVDHTLSLPSKSLQRNGLCGFWASQGTGGRRDVELGQTPFTQVK